MPHAPTKSVLHNPRLMTGAYLCQRYQMEDEDGHKYNTWWHGLILGMAHAKNKKVPRFRVNWTPQIRGAGPTIGDVALPTGMYSCDPVAPPTSWFLYALPTHKTQLC